MICWGLGAFGLGLTGMLETNTKEDMGEHSQLILLWAANLASQPNTARHLLAAKRRARTSSRSTCAGPRPPRSPTTCC